MDLQAARQQGVGRLDVVAGAQHPPPAQRVHDHPGADVAAVGVDDSTRSGRSTFAVSNANSP